MWDIRGYTYHRHIRDEVCKYGLFGKCGLLCSLSLSFSAESDGTFTRTIDTNEYRQP